MKKQLLISAALLGFGLANLSIVAAETGVPPEGIAVKDSEKIAFLGDSITQQGFVNPSGYVNLVISGLGACGLKVTPIPAGISGHKSKDMLARLDKDVIAKKPDWVTISCGVNDVWHGANGVELEPYKTNMTALVDRCQAAGIKVMLLTATMIKEDQANPENQRLVAYNEFLRALAKDKNCLLADLNSSMQAAVKAPGGAESAPGKKLTGDGVHMNAFGNQMMAAGVLAAFGLTDSQIKAAKDKWYDIPNAMNLGTISVTLRQYQCLEALAAKRKQTVKAIVDAAVAKTMDDLIKEAR